MTDFSIIIIDNGSVDKTLEVLSEKFPHLKVVKHKNNLGFAKAHNQALHWTKSELVVVLNQDVVLDKNYLLRAVSFLEAHKAVGAVTGKLLRMQEAELTNYIDTVGHKIFKNYRVIDLGSGEVDNGQYDGEEEVFGVAATVAVYRRQALEDVRYKQEFFDELFFSYKEDVDMSHRLQTAGWKIWRVPSAIAFHDRTVTVSKEKQTKLRIASEWKRKSKFAKFYSYRNHLYFIFKNAPRWSWAVLGQEAVKFLYILFIAPKNLKAWQDVWRNRDELRAKRKFINEKTKVSPVEMAKWWE